MSVGDERGCCCDGGKRCGDDARRSKKPRAGYVGGCETTTGYVRDDGHQREAAVGAS